MTSPSSSLSGERRANAVPGHPSAVEPPPATAPPMYWRVLRLSAVRPNGWQRAVLVEGVIGISVVLALADVASAWTIVVLPLVAMGIVKAHDHLGGLLHPARRDEPPPARVSDYATFAGIPIVILLLRLITHPSGAEAAVGAVVLGVLVVGAAAVFGYRYMRRSP